MHRTRTWILFSLILAAFAPAALSAQIVRHAKLGTGFGAPPKARAAKAQGSVDTGPQARDTWLGARDCIERGEFEAAESMSRLSLGDNDNRSFSKTLLKETLAESLLRQGRNREALSYEQQVYDAFHSHESYVRVALLLCRMNRTAESLKMVDGLQLKQMVPKDYEELLPDVRRGASMEGLWLFAAGYLSSLHSDFGSAVYYLDGARKKLPKNPIVLLELGRAYVSQRRPDLAVDALSGALRVAKGSIKSAAWRLFVDADSALTPDQRIAHQASLAGARRHSGMTFKSYPG